MENISYVATFISLILGLSVANLLAGVSRFVRRGDDADWYGIHTGWAVFIFVVTALEWWVTLNWKSHTVTSLMYLFLLLKPCILFIASDIIFPERGSRVTDLKEYFYSIRPRLLLILALYPALDIVDSAMKGMNHLRQLGLPYALFIGAGFVALFIGSRTKSEPVQYALLVLMFVNVIASMSNALGAVSL